TSTLEGKADDAKTAVRMNLPVRILLPVDRRDVLRLLSQIDAIADCAEDVGVLLTIRRMEVPDEMKALLGELVGLVLRAVRTAAELVHGIDALIASGFGGKPAATAYGLIDEVRQRENEADKVQDQLAKVLFQLEDRLPPAALFMWTKILNKIGDM